MCFRVLRSCASTGCPNSVAVPLAGRQQPRQHLHRGRLAAAIGAEEAEDFAALDPEADMIDRGELTESAGQSARLDARLAAARAPAAG